MCTSNVLYIQMILGCLLVNLKLEIIQNTPAFTYKAVIQVEDTVHGNNWVTSLRQCSEHRNIKPPKGIPKHKPSTKLEYKLQK